jgi:hypothetical protein
VDDAAVILAGDAASILATVTGRATIERWTTRRFADGVASVRRHLVPLADPDLLISSFGREAFHRPGIDPVPAVAGSPVRVAYAIRWIELRTGFDLPEWSPWIDGCSPVP